MTLHAIRKENLSNITLDQQPGGLSLLPNCVSVRFKLSGTQFLNVAMTSILEGTFISRHEVTAHDGDANDEHINHRMDQQERHPSLHDGPHRMEEGSC